MFNILALANSYGVAFLMSAVSMMNFMLDYDAPVSMMMSPF
jgi:hypothetical protein